MVAIPLSCQTSSLSPTHILIGLGATDVDMIIMRIEDLRIEGDETQLRVVRTGLTRTWELSIESREEYISLSKHSCAIHVSCCLQSGIETE